MEQDGSSLISFGPALLNSYHPSFAVPHCGRMQTSLICALKCRKAWRTRHSSRPVPGRNFLAALRLYGTGVEFFDQSWKPDDLGKVK